MLQRLFDSFIPPEQLTTKLAEKERDLRIMNFFPDQLKILYPDKGKCAESKNFDITLLSRLLKIFWPPVLPEPAAGWKDPPGDGDTNVAHDCVRIKIYRDIIYGHNTKMELDDKTFEELWKKISDALIRIASYVSEDCGNQWKNAIADFRNGSLTEDEKRLHKETLDRWCAYDQKLQQIEDILKEMHSTTKDTNERVQVVQPVVEDTNRRVKEVELELKKLHEGKFWINIF